MDNLYIHFKAGTFRITFLLLSALLAGCGNEGSEPSGADDSSVAATAGANGHGSGVKFVDVTASAGITFVHTNGASGTRYLPESNGSGAAFFDYDNDGDLDLYLVNSAAFPGFQVETEPINVLYQNNGDGTFTDVTARAGVGDTGYGQGCAAGDYDNDGDQDLYVTNLGPNVFYQNNGDGTFTDVTAKAGVGDRGWGTSCAFADYDHDGDLDLYVVNYLDFTVETHQECRARGYPIYCGVDVYDGVADVLYRNDGQGRFTDVTKPSGVYNPEGKGFGVVWFDYDNDADLDIYVVNDMVRNFLYRNQGDGTFEDVSLMAGAGYNEEGMPEAGMGTDAGDFNRDGLLDLFVTNYQGETNTLYLNEGNGFFTDIALASGAGQASWRYLGWGTRFFDHDNDGDLDIFVANGHINDNIEEWDDIGTYAQQNYLFDNTGAEGESPFRFRDISATLLADFTREAVSRGAAFGDYDNDGDLDILVTNVAAAPVLLRNDGGNRRNWLGVRVVGTRANRDAIGARVKVVSGSLVQVGEVRSGSGYLCQNDLRLLFGLNQHATVDSVIVRWPGGALQEVTHVTTNQFLTVVEE